MERTRLLCSVGALALCVCAHSVPFAFSTGNPDGLVGMGSRPDPTVKLEIEAADDFVTNGATTVHSGSFTGLLTGQADVSAIQFVGVEIYRVFPLDSGPPTGNVPTRVNSPSDIAFDTRDTLSENLTFTTTVLNQSFTAANSVLNGIHPIPGNFTGGEGPIQGQEVRFDFALTSDFALPANHYFFVPQVGLSTGEFYWLSAPKPIVPPGTPFTPDLQAWIRNKSLAPDWLRVGTDIIGGAPVNGAFSLDGQVTPEPATFVAVLAVGALLARRKRKV